MTSQFKSGVPTPVLLSASLKRNTWCPLLTLPMDGHIINGSYNMTIRIWNAKTGSAVDKRYERQMGQYSEQRGRDTAG